MNIAHHQRQKYYSRNELQGIQILRTKDDGNSTRIIYHTATIIKLYPYVVQLQLENGQYTSPGYTKLYLMLHGADEE